MSALKVLQDRIHQLARKTGWYDGAPCPRDPTWLAARAALIHTEVSEFVECVRVLDIDYRKGPDGKPEGAVAELADIVIRCLDLAGSLGIDLGEVLWSKHFYNETRTWRHGGKAL